MGITYDIVESRPWTLEDMIMAGLVTTSALGVLMAWWREGIGGIILVICAAAHSTFAYIVAGHNKALAMLVSGGPFFLIGSLFLTVWWRSRKRVTTQALPKTGTNSTRIHTDETDYHGFFCLYLCTSV